VRQHISNDGTSRNENFRVNGALRAGKRMRIREIQTLENWMRKEIKSGYSSDLRGKVMFSSSQIVGVDKK
jgi:hypothetical protein